jgi:hypothetical protein
VTAERKVGEWFAFAVFPVLWLVDATVGQALGSRPRGAPYAIDFHPVWRAAHAYLLGTNPYPTTIAVLHSADAHPIGHASDVFVYPLPVAAILSPLGALPYSLAAAVFTVVSVAAILLALRLLDVRDWRCYGIAFATPAVMTAVSWGTLTPLLVLCIAAAWRYRDSAVRCGVAVAVAIVLKVFLWPLLLWLLLARRFRAAGIAVSVASFAVVAASARVGYGGLLGYPQLMHDLASVQAARGESLAAIVGSGPALAALTLLGFGAATLLLLRVRDERIALSALILLAIWLSPIAWVHYFALVLPLLAIWSPVFSLAWVVPLGFWLILSQQPHQPWRIGLAIAVSAGAALVAARKAVSLGRPQSVEGPAEAVLSGLAVSARSASIRT